MKEIISSPEVTAPARQFAPASAMVIALSIGQVVSWGTLFYAFTLFIVPMEAEFGWSRTELNGALSLGLLASAIMALPAGTLIDRFGGRWIMGICAVLGAACLALWSMISDLTSFYLLWIVIGMLHAGTLYEPAFAVLTANVRDYKRAITFMTFFGGFASTVFIPLTHLLIDHFGWRQALLALAIIQLTIPGIFNILMLSGTRGSMSGEAVTPSTTQEHSPLTGALRQPAFWGLSLALTAYALLFSGLTFHMIPLLSERGVSLDQTVAAVALIGPSQVGGRLILFFFATNVSARALGKVVFLMPIVAMILLIAAPPFGFPGLVAFAFVYGLGNGMITIVRGAGVAEIFGTRGYGAISGALTLVTNLAKAIAPLLLAFLWQIGENYQTPLHIFLVITCIGAAAFWFAASASKNREIQK
ncbi:MFS transporter [Candidatus Raskinella chloraquaticus]|uniref:Major facilitator superfamily (MFS) profile domain-containing protein n=1 Tax=Candidatus Raskinella chloraquaticus TaxID=1951219 RepID=A0A1W9HUL2_9HYPH|nr:MAG: hypothetical protein A4S15_13205 [Proteobacteria bacterium SG_bin8]